MYLKLVLTHFWRCCIQSRIGLVIPPRPLTFIAQTWGCNSIEPSAYVSPVPYPKFSMINSPCYSSHENRSTATPKSAIHRYFSRCSHHYIIPHVPICSHDLPSLSHIIPHYPTLSHTATHYPTLSHIMPD